MLELETPNLEDAIAEVVETLENTPLDQLLAQLRVWFAALLPKLGWMLLVFIAGYIVIRLLMRLIRTLLKKSKVDPTLHTFVLTSIKIVLYLLLVLTCLGVMGIPITPLLTALGALSLALSLAVKDTLSNVAGGISVLFSRPFGKGDFVEVGSVSGTVRELGMVYTLVRTTDNRHVYLPNGDVAKATVINYSREENRRADLVFSVRAGADAETAKRIIRDAVAGCPMALSNPAPIVRTSDQSYALIKISCMVWAHKDNLFEMKGYLIETIRRRLTEAGLDAAVLPPRTGEGKA